MEEGFEFTNTNGERIAPPLDPKDLFRVPYERVIVEAVDSLFEERIKLGRPPVVKTDAHWKLIEKIFIYWSRLYPEEFKQFEKAQKLTKMHQRNRHASTREQGGAEIQHLATLPRKFDQMVKLIFPLQRTQDSQFIRKLARKMPLFKNPDSRI